MPSTNNRRSVTEILSALKSALESAQWTPAGGGPVAAFQKVKLFDLAQLADAFSELLVSEQRVCLLVPDAEKFESALQGNTRLLIKRTLPVALLLSDRVVGDRQQALHGAEASGGSVAVAGAFPLQEIALAAVTGQLLPNPKGVVCRPVTATVLDVQDTKRKMPGRACIELDVECTGGTLDATITTNL